MKIEKLKVVFDSSVIVTGWISGSLHRTGLFRVSFEVLKQLAASEKYELYLYDIYHRERELQKLAKKEFPGCRVIYIYSLFYRNLIFPIGNIADFLRVAENSTGPKSNIAYILKNVFLFTEKLARKTEKIFITQKYLQHIFNNFHLYFSTYYPIPDYITAIKSIKKVYTIHDVIPIIHPEFFSSSFNYELVNEVVTSIEDNDTVICVSHSTRNDLLAIRPELDSDRIFVALLAAADCFSPVKDEIKLHSIYRKYNLPEGKQYLLSVCTFEPRKNLSAVVKAFRNLLENGRGDNLSLVLTGAPYWDKDQLLDEIENINKYFKNAVVLTGFVEDEELAILYTGAIAFVYPSFYEGFGLPPLESMSCGTPVIGSNNSSLPEVIGDSGILVDPYDISQIEKAIILLTEDKNLHETLSNRSVMRSAKFRWESTAKVIMQAFDYRKEVI